MLISISLLPLSPEGIFYVAGGFNHRLLDEQSGRNYERNPHNIIEGAGHFDVYEGDHLQKAAAGQIAWIKEHLNL